MVKLREAIGNSLLFNLVIVFVALVILFFVGILAYSKAYRVKNRIIETIEKYGDYYTAIEEIETDLKTMGYSSAFNSNCSDDNLNTSTYKYCIYYKESGDSSYYYKVVTYVHFDFPIIGDFVTFPVHGETKILGKSYNYE